MSPKQEHTDPDPDLVLSDATLVHPDPEQPETNRVAAPTSPPKWQVPHLEWNPVGVRNQTSAQLANDFADIKGLR